ncbi:MAG: cadherin-like domain-containing protein, partial [Verrucomicrobiota bacterium]
MADPFFDFFQDFSASFDESQLNQIDGTDRSERLRGTKGDDQIFGFGGSDRIAGRSGDDIIFSGAGFVDRISGGRGDDVFTFGDETSNGHFEIDIIQDYGRGDDKIDLGGAEVAHSWSLFGKTFLKLEGDGDLVVVKGARKFSDIDFVPNNEAPIALDDLGFEAVSGETIEIAVADLLANDTDADGDPLSIIEVTNAVSGSVILDDLGTQDTADDLVRFTPDEDFAGEASFDYVVSDGQSTDEATVSITISNNLSFDVFPGAQISIDLLEAFPGFQASELQLVSDQNLPTGSIDGNGVLTFRPTPDDLGSFEFSVIAGAGDAAETLEYNLDVVPDPNTTTRVSGQILSTEGVAISGITISLDGDEAITDADGRFVITVSDEIGDDTLRVLAGDASDSVFPSIAEPLPLLLFRDDVFEGVNNIIDRPIFLPELDLANATPIDPGGDTLVQTPVLPGASVFVAANTLTTPEGEPFVGSMTITEVPRELTPAALPPNLLPDLVVTIQPGELTFGQPAPLSLPNTCDLAPGTELDLYSINPETGEFDRVGLGRVSADGSVIETVEGGIINSSWHFFADFPPTEIFFDEVISVTPGPPVVGDPELNPRNPKNDGCDCDEAEQCGTSTVKLHSGAVIETHDLVTYQSEGETRGLSFVYDSLRADPSYILNFSYGNAPDTDTTKLVADMVIRNGDFEFQVPGAPAGFGLDGGAHFWSIPEGGGNIDAAIYASMENFATGQYEYDLTSGLLCFTGASFTGSTITQTGTFQIVNTMDSPFGAGWGIAGLQELVENGDGSVLLVDGDGTELLFRQNDDGTYQAPVGDF